jgi:hypothetical protein
MCDDLEDLNNISAINDEDDELPNNIDNVNDNDIFNNTLSIDEITIIEGNENSLLYDNELTF